MKTRKHHSYERPEPVRKDRFERPEPDLSVEINNRLEPVAPSPPMPGSKDPPPEAPPNQDQPPEPPPPASSDPFDLHHSPQPVSVPHPETGTPPEVEPIANADIHHSR